MPTGHSFGDDGAAVPLKRDEVDDDFMDNEGEVPELYSSATRRNSHSSQLCSYQRDSCQGISSDPQSQPRLQQTGGGRIRPRHSEPLSLGTSSTSSTFSSSYSIPRASERLLRLQNSLADLRLQRRAAASKDLPTSDSSMHRPGTKPLVTGRRDSSRSGPTKQSSTNLEASASDSSSSNVREQSSSRPPSPTFADLARSRIARERERDRDNEDDSGDESDLGAFLKGGPQEPKR